MRSTRFVIYVIFHLLLTAYADPKCVTYQEKDVICTAGDSDYVLRRGLVSDNNKTTAITLRNCRITEMDYEAFENDDNLNYIDLSQNRIAELKLGVLDGNKEVTYLNLSHNIITKFPLGLFDQKPNIDILDLKGNKLNSLEIGIFDPLQKLVHLDLSSNLLQGRDISPYLFDKSHDIKFMDFSRNDMSDAPELLLHAFWHLDFLNLDRCSLTEVPSFVTRPNLKTMRHLMLSTNQITKIDKSWTFMNLENLEILNLADNFITELPDSVFTSLKKLKMVVLRNNRLTYIPNNLFLNIKSLGNVDLSYNAIDFVPVNAFRGTGLKNLNLSHNRFTYLDANFCLELRNSGVRLNKFYFNDNLWQCACLNEILKEAKTYNIRYNHAKYSGTSVVCVTTKMFTCKRQLADNAIFIEMFENKNM